jgi:hypothetical protein
VPSEKFWDGEFWRVKLPAKTLREISRRYRKGRSVTTIADYLGLARSTVRRNLLASGVTLRDHIEASRVSKRPKHYRKRKLIEDLSGPRPLATASLRLTRGEPRPGGKFRKGNHEWEKVGRKPAGTHLPAHPRRRRRSRRILGTTGVLPPVKIRPDIHRRFGEIVIRANRKYAATMARIAKIPVQGDDDWVGSPIGFNSQIG